MLSVLAVLLSALCFSTTGTALALADVNASPYSVGAVRILLGGGILGLIALNSLRGRTGAAETSSSPRRVPSWVIILIGAIGVLAYQPTFFAGTRLNGVAIGTVIALGSAPIMTGILDALISRRLPTFRWAVATGIALIGVVMVSGLVGIKQQASTFTPEGILASLGAGVSYALYAVASKRLLDRSWSSSRAIGAIFGVAALLSLPVLAITSTAWLTTSAGIKLTLWLGVVTTTIAYLLFAWGLKKLSPATVSTLTLAEPLGATLLGLIVLHEQLTPVAIVGLIVIVLGLLVLSIPSRPDKTLADTLQEE